LRPYLKKPITKKRAGRVAQGVGPDFKSQYCKKKSEVFPSVYTNKGLSSKARYLTSQYHSAAEHLCWSKDRVKWSDPCGNVPSLILGPPSKRRGQ
jgi:hypothetical protein